MVMMRGVTDGRVPTCPRSQSVGLILLGGGCLAVTQGRIQPIYVISPFHKQVIYLRGVPETIPGGVNEGDTPPLQADDGAL